MVWGAIQAWNYRFELFFGDSQAYFDMSHYFMQGQFDKAVSLYWSPLYSMIAGLMWKVIPPDRYWQFFQFKLVNFVFLIVTFLTYEFFFKHFYKYYMDVVLPENAGALPASDAGDESGSACVKAGQTPALPAVGEAALPAKAIDKNTLRFSGYALLILFSLAFGGVHQDTPDMINAALFFLTSGYLLKLLIKPNIRDACLFGAVLGLGYWCKAIMFCMSLIFIALLSIRFIPLLRSPRLSAPDLKRDLACIFVSFACFAVVSAPWVWTLSNKLGQLTIGESAKFVYINLVEEKDPLTVEGLKHPPRVLLDKPLIREYATPVSGTVPFLYDLGYWSYGARVHFRIADLIKVIVSDLIYYLHTFLYIPILVVGLVAIKARSWPLSFSKLKYTAPIWLPPVALCAQYALVNNLYMIPYIDRYFIAAYPLMMLAILVSLDVPEQRQKVSKNGQDARAPSTSHLLKHACLFTTAFCLLIAFGTRFVQDITDLFKEKQNTWYIIGQTLHDGGVQPGQTVAQLGGRLHRNTQYTEPYKIKLIASVYDEGYFWEMPVEKKQEVYDILRNIGIRALVYVRIPDMEDPMITRDLKLLKALTGVQLKMPFKEFPVPADLTGWKAIPGVDAYYYPL